MADCNAVPKADYYDQSYDDAITNAKALKECLQKANNTLDTRTVIIPEDYTFTAMAVNITNLFNVTLQIDGTWEATPHYEYWPL